MSARHYTQTFEYDPCAVCLSHIGLPWAAPARMNLKKSRNSHKAIALCDELPRIESSYSPL
eukprot:32608-Eustigmatos_ZCMA.PRE.1